MYSNYSADSIDTSDCEDGSKEKVVKTFAKQMLKTTIFVGTFEEKRFVESVNDYRDVIRIEPDELKLIENLRAVQRKILFTLPKQLWIGITNPSTPGVPEGYCLWVTLPETTLGKYWFKIKSVVLNDKEFRIKLEKVRPFRDDSPKITKTVKTEHPGLNEFFDKTCDNFKSNVLYFLNEVCTMNNIKNATIFLSLLLVTILTGAINIMKYLLEYLLKLLRETSNLIKVVSPILITSINVLGKVIYGTIHSILNVFRPQPRVTYPPAYYNMNRQNYPQISDVNYNRRAIAYRPSVEITEIYD